jgi:hypothetical protein
MPITAGVSIMPVKSTTTRKPKAAKAKVKAVLDMDALPSDVKAVIIRLDGGESEEKAIRAYLMAQCAELQAEKFTPSEIRDFAITALGDMSSCAERMRNFIADDSDGIDANDEDAL